MKKKVLLTITIIVIGIISFSMINISATEIINVSTNDELQSEHLCANNTDKIRIYTHPSVIDFLKKILSVDTATEKNYGHILDDNNNHSPWFSYSTNINFSTFNDSSDIETVYLAAWIDRTGENFDDAFIAEANQQYNVTTTEYDQFVYFEFVPEHSKMYNFYSTGSLDTHGYLYNSNKSQILNRDDGGDGNNFYISYNLTAGETYYLVVKCHSEPGAFTVFIEEPVDYRINEITINDMLGNSLSQIPQGSFLAKVSITNVSSNKEPVIVLAQYTATGVFKTLDFLNVEDMSIGSTVNITVPIDNTNGDVAKLKAFCWKSFSSMIPMGNSTSFPVE